MLYTHVFVIFICVCMYTVYKFKYSNPGTSSVYPYAMEYVLFE